MARLPPDCAICCEPLATDLAAPSTCGHVYHRTCLANWLQRNPACAQRRCPVCRRPCRTSEVIGLQFELAQPADDTLEEPQGDDVRVLQVRLSMAHANIKALLEAEAARRRENLLLQGKLASLEGQLLSHVERTSKAEAVASECRNKLVQLQASRDRVSAELLQVKREAERQAALKKYSNEASSLTQAKAVEFLRGKCGEDIDEALRTQHGTICELQNENARLRSEKLAQRRHFKAEVERKNELIRRLRVTDEVLFPSGCGQAPSSPCPSLSLSICCLSYCSSISYLQLRGTAFEPLMQAAAAATPSATTSLFEAAEFSGFSAGAQDQTTRRSPKDTPRDQWFMQLQPAGQL